jgi:hypothetical protein
LLDAFFVPAGDGEIEETTMRPLYVEKLEAHERSVSNGARGGRAKAANAQ